MAAIRVGDREARAVDARAYPAGAPLGERLAFLLRYAVLAPSSHNAQPWRFAVDGPSVLVRPDPERWLPVADPDRRELYISLGCALENLVIAARHFGLDARVEYGADAAEDAAARVTFGPAVGPGCGEQLFEALTRRMTNREPFEDRAVGGDVLQAFHRCCTDLDEVQLWLITDRATRGRVEDLVDLADRAAFASPEYRRELAQWVGAGAFGTSWLESAVGRVAVAGFDMGPAAARHDVALVASAPLVGILTTTRDDRAAQVRVGRAFERIVLTAFSIGIGCQPLSQIVQVPETRRALAELIPGPYVVQHPFRAGYGLRGRPTPRRRVDEVVGR